VLTQRDPWLDQQLIDAAASSMEGRAEAVQQIIIEIRDRGSVVSADDEVLLGTLLGAALTNGHHYEDAQAALDEVRPLLTAARPRRQARFLAISARTTEGLRKGDHALDLAVRALALVNDDGQPPDADVCSTLGNCTVVFAMLELFPLAIQTGERAVAAGLAAGQPVGRWHFHLGFTHMCRSIREAHVGMLQESQTERLKAIDRLQEALASPDLPILLQSWASAWLSSCASKQLRVDLAQESLRRAKELPLDPPNWSVRQSIAEAEANLAMATGQWDRAKAALTKLWPAVVKVRHPLWCEEVAWMLGEVSAQQGDYAEALHWHREMHQRYGRSQYEAWRSRGTAARLAVEQQALIRRTHQLEYDIMSDPLTGVANRRSFDSSLPKLVTASHSTGTPFTLVILDVDHFKQINDMHGHPTGDEVLRQIAQIISEDTRNADRCARYGGDELVICLPERMPEATVAAARIAQKIADHPWDALSPGLTVTVSSGLAQLGPGDTATTLFWTADQSLLAAKAARKSGRAREGRYANVADSARIAAGS
jgi:diguanylate cyclase (GGDEF)-like protein